MANEMHIPLKKHFVSSYWLFGHVYLASSAEAKNLMTLL
jgi:hypothetical protein